MSKPIASLSLDMDNKWSYMKTHGDAGWDQYPTYLDTVVPRFLKVLHEQELKMTVFIVGQDAAREENFEAIASIGAAGHEIGNHSFNHEPWLHLYSEQELVTELAKTEEHLERVTGQCPIGFRGPGFSFTEELLQILIRRGYKYDCSTFPTFLGPVARLYYFMSTRLDKEQRAERKELFGQFSEGFRPLRPFQWEFPEGELTEIPVTTMPFVKAPIHASYILYLAQYSTIVAKTYWKLSLAMCRMAKVAPSLLLHPLDFMGADDDSDLAFFPAMGRPAEPKVELTAWMINEMSKHYDIRPMKDHAMDVRARLNAASSNPPASLCQRKPTDRITIMMSRPVRLMCVFGTRPEAIKVAPIIMAGRRRSDVEIIACSTGQHREMLDQVTSYFGIQSDVDLNLMKPGQSLTGLTSRCLAALGEVVEQKRPDCILGQGDTTSAMCAGMVAFFHQLPFVHVEAGLRTDDIRSPFPEELNRRVCSLVSNLHCAPTQTAASNLFQEGYSSEDVIVTGNTVIDALKWAAEKERADSHRWIEKHPEIADSRMVLITAHRRENHGEGIRDLCRAIRTLAGKFPTVRFVYPVHLNPNIHEPVHEMLGGIQNIDLIAPAEYPEFVWLMDRATLILSDSGGVQEEAPSLGKPVLVVRESTERPEALEAGATRLIGTNTERVIAEVSRLLVDKDAYASMQIDTNPYGNGTASKQILDLVSQRVSVQTSQVALT